MFTRYTYQDLIPVRQRDLPDFCLKCVESYRGSSEFRRALEASDYFCGRNRQIMQKYLLRADVQTETDERGRTRRSVRNVRVKGNQLPSSFFRKAVLQLSQYLLGNGVILRSAEDKERLGPGFDKALEEMGQQALVQGLCWGFFNLDHLEVIPAAGSSLCGFVPLYDEENGEPGAGIQFWQIDEDRPLRLRLFERGGVTLMSFHEGKLLSRGTKMPYVSTPNEEAPEWPFLPVIPLYANNEKESELTPAIKRKIDAYDNILSDLGNNLDRANDVYWVLNNFGGEMQQALEVQEQINRLKMVISRNDLGTGPASAEARTVEVPYEARRTALNILHKQLYADFMALDMESVTGGSLTNVAIRAAMSDLDLKCSGFEWQCFRFVQRVLALNGVTTEEVVFRRQSISNAHETVQDIYLMRGDIDRRAALEMNPYIDQDTAERLLKNSENEKEEKTR